ncbi:MAG: SDR family oxidoreductase [Steroidobacteraceae bacterium]|jgi:NAD(P)-dependent dehydrogenase (short-subunit alcohol dehydrogenase family)|nr:SDR family oxidoreductase [Steroidobacteraceae bacterium]
MIDDPTRSFRLDGRVALVTGASSGIGATLARALAAAGARVALAARRLERIEKLAADIRADGGTALPVVLDVTDRAAIPVAFDAVERALGVVDVVLNNAGMAEPALFLKTGADALERTMATNFTAPWQVAAEAARRLVAAGQPGSIINVASVLALGAAPGYAAYSASKGALVQLTRSLALEFVRHRIRVNALAPGWFVSEMNEAFFASDKGKAYVQRMPPGRTGELRELVGPTLLLASDAGSYVNGVVLPVDGAHHAALV